MAHEKWAIDFSEICWFGLVTLSYFLIFTLTSQNVLCSMSKSHILHRNIFICQWKKFDKMVDWCDSWGEHSEQSTHERRNRVPERVPIRYSSGFHRYRGHFRSKSGTSRVLWTCHCLPVCSHTFLRVSYKSFQCGSIPKKSNSFLIRRDR